MKHALVVVSLLLWLKPALGQDGAELMRLAEAEVPAYLATLESLVAIESGSRDVEGLAEIAGLIAGRLGELGGTVETIDVAAEAVRLSDTPEVIGNAVLARFAGTGTVDVLLLAHMDTVYQRGMGADQPFRTEGDRIYGLGIADNKHGIAIILHAIELLNELDFSGFGKLTVLINADEEISSPGSRRLIERLGRQHDVVFSADGPGPEDRVGLATSGIGVIELRVTGRASHAGVSPEEGRNALYELAHQVLQMRDLSDPSRGVKLNWTLAEAGSVRNAVPASAVATADVRMIQVADWDRVVQSVLDLSASRLIEETSVEVVAEFRRPPLESNPASVALAAHVAGLYAATGRSLEVETEPAGGGTDAAFAGLSSDAAVVEGMGVVGFGAHSNDAEYILRDAIAPRLYLLVRSIMDVANGAVEALQD
jgi:glutamate carboxypeptidase